MSDDEWLAAIDRAQQQFLAANRRVEHGPPPAWALGPTPTPIEAARHAREAAIEAEIWVAYEAGAQDAFDRVCCETELAIRADQAAARYAAQELSDGDTFQRDGDEWLWCVGGDLGGRSGRAATLEQAIIAAGAASRKQRRAR